VQINPIQFACMRQEKSIVNFAFAVHALTALGFTHEFGKTIFQNTGTDSAKHVIPRLPLQNHGLNAFEMKQLGQHQT
jgi:hypothetical protein